jgi:hypothetical protein
MRPAVSRRLRFQKYARVTILTFGSKILMRFKFILLALLVIPAPAFADWQPTKWGMTSDEVIKATGNQAKPNTDTDAESTEPLVMTYSEAGVHFTVYFQFDEQTKTLKGVKLVPENRDCQKAFDILKAKYGAPASSVQGAVGEMEKWQDAAGPNRISALALPSRSAANYCSITYRPLAAAGPPRS